MNEHKIVIVFKDDGSALFDMDVVGNIYANQFLMLANFFEYQGKQMLNDQRISQMMAEQERQDRNKLIIPKSGMLSS